MPQQQQLQRLRPQRRLQQLLFLLGFKILPTRFFFSFNERKIVFQWNILKTFEQDEPKCENTTVPYPPGEGEWSCDYENQYCTLGCPHHCHMKKAENNPVYW